MKLEISHKIFFYCITTDERISIKRAKEIWIFISNIIEWTPFSQMTFFSTRVSFYSREQFESHGINNIKKKFCFFLFFDEFPYSWYLCWCKCVILMIIWKCYVWECRIPGYYDECPKRLNFYDYREMLQCWKLSSISTSLL